MAIDACFWYCNRKALKNKKKNAKIIYLLMRVPNTLNKMLLSVNDFEISLSFQQSLNVIISI